MATVLQVAFEDCCDKFDGHRVTFEKDDDSGELNFYWRNTGSRRKEFSETMSSRRVIL